MVSTHSTYIGKIGWLDIECTPQQLNNEEKKIQQQKVNILSECNITNSLNVPLSLLPCVPLFVQFLSIFIFTFIFIASLLVHFTAKRNVINADEVMQLIHKQPTNKWRTTTEQPTNDENENEKRQRETKKNDKINCATNNQFPPLYSTIHHLICAKLGA